MEGKIENNEDNNRSNFNFGREREKKVELGRSKVQSEKEKVNEREIAILPEFIAKKRVKECVGEIERV